MARILFMKHQFNGKALFPLHVPQETKKFFDIPGFGLSPSQNMFLFYMIYTLVL